MSNEFNTATLENLGDEVAEMTMVEIATELSTAGIKTLAAYTGASCQRCATRPLTLKETAEELLVWERFYALPDGPM
jgi:hypothetical protein